MLTASMPELSVGMFALLFAEGFLAFVSPCILPMLPIYLLYLSGENSTNQNISRRLRNAVGFILGFTTIFVILGATASGLSILLQHQRPLLQRISGIIMILFGLHFCGLLHIPVLSRTKTFSAHTGQLRFFSSFIFGAAFSFGWTPCLGPFLGSAMLLASQANTIYAGIALLFTFSLGLGVPFLLAAILWERLQGAVRFLQRHLLLIQRFSGALLIVVGLLLLFNKFSYYLRLFY